jgi:hypothetical protein
VNWKTDLQLADLDATTAIEVVCKRCGLSRYEKQAQLMNEHPEFSTPISMRLNTACVVQIGAAAEVCVFRSFMTTKMKDLSAEWHSRS